MEINKLFTKKEPTQEEMLKRQQEYEHNNILASNATSPQHSDEQWLSEAREKYADLRRWQQDLAPKFREMFENLCGKKITQNGKMIDIPHINPIMNINGAYQIVNFLKNLDVNVIMSNYAEYGIKQALRWGVGLPLISLIRNNYRAYGMSKNTGNFSYVINMALNSAEPTFNRAWKGGEREADSKIMRISRMENEGQREEKKGLFK